MPVVLAGCLVVAVLLSAARAQAESPGEGGPENAPPASSDIANPPDPIVPKREDAEPATPEPPRPPPRVHRRSQRVDRESPEPVGPPSETPATEESTASSKTYSGQIVLADVICIAAAPLGGVSLLAYPFAAPIIHGVHGHGGRATGSLALRLVLPLSTALAGAFLEASSRGKNSDCGEMDGCYLAGAAVGLVVGMIVASTIDAAVLARLSDRTPPSMTTSASLPTVSLARSGLRFGWRGRF
jgi:hypothetical protein